MFIVSISASLAIGCNGPETGNTSKPKPVATTPNYLDTGKLLAGKAQSTLAKNLVEAINKGGAEFAVGFCNANASQITDSMSRSLHAGIKRVSDKPRNQANLANKEEWEYIVASKLNMRNGMPPEPKVVEKDGVVTGYYPIVTNAMCLQCHGNVSTDIKAETLGKIRKAYPEDKATGYGVNELRGLWVVEMPKK